MSFVISDDFDTVFTLIEQVNCSSGRMGDGVSMDGCMIIALYCGRLSGN